MILEDYEALKCRYPSKKCWNQRAVKRNGERHNLCEMHRQKANNNQRRLDKKRKAGHMLKGGPSPLGSGAENELPEYDAYHQHSQHSQHSQHPHSHSHSSQEHYEHQQEKRMRVRLTDMYVAAQSLSPHSPHSQHAHQRYHQHLQHRERELAPLLPRSPSRSQQQVLHLPPLTSHIPLIKQSTSPQSLKNLVAAGAAAMKPTILLPPITSVPRCQYPGSSGSSSVSNSPHPGWSGFRYGEEPKVNVNTA